MTTEEFNKIVAATGRNFECEQTISGYYRLVCGDEIISDDSADEVTNGTEEEAMNLFAYILLDEYVPEDKKFFHFGGWKLKE